MGIIQRMHDALVVALAQSCLARYATDTTVSGARCLLWKCCGRFGLGCVLCGAPRTRPAVSKMRSLACPNMNRVVYLCLTRLVVLCLFVCRAIFYATWRVSERRRRRRRWRKLRCAVALSRKRRCLRQPRPSKNSWQRKWRRGK